MSGSRMLDARAGRMYTMELNPDFLLELLSSDRPEAQRLAALHCMLVYLQPNPVIELKVREREREREICNKDMCWKHMCDSHLSFGPDYKLDQ